MLVRRFLIYVPRPQATSDGSEVAAVTRLASRLGLRTVSNGYTLAYERAADGTSHRAASDRRRPVDASILLHTLPGAAASPIADELVALANDPDAWEAFARRRVQFFNQIVIGPARLEIRSDPLGMLPYYQAELGPGTVLASSLRDLFSCFPELIRPVDPMGLALRLVKAGAGTVHARVRRPPPGARWIWERESGIRIERGSRLSAPMPDSRISDAEAIDRIMTAMNRCLLAFMEGDGPAVLPLSGGFDSRLVACLCRGCGVDVDAVTLGYARQTEMKVAKRVARRLELSHRAITPHTELLDQIDLWLETTEGQAGLGSIFVTDVLDPRRDRGASLLSGCLGNPLTGTGLLRMAATNPPHRRDAVAVVMAGRHHRLRPDFVARLGLQIDRDAFEAEIERALPEAPEPHQAALLWVLENRSRASESGMLLHLGRQYRVGTPYYDPDVVDAWLGLPRSALDDRALLRELFGTVFPQVGSIPHSEEPVPTLWMNRFSNRVRDGILRRLVPEYDYRKSFWGTYSRLTPVRRAVLMQRLSNKRHAVPQVLDWDPEEAVGPEFWKTLATDDGMADKVLVSYYLLTEYCDWLRRTITSA